MKTRLRLERAGSQGPEVGHRWGAFISQTMGRQVEYVRMQPSTREVTAEVRPLGSLRLCTLSCGPYELRCAPVGELGVVAPRRGEWHVCLQLSGEMTVDSGDMRHVFRAGEWGLHAASRAFYLRQPVPIEQLVLIIPRDQVPIDLMPLAALLSGPQDAEQGAGRLLVTALRECQRELDHLPASAHESVAQSLLSLLRAALLERAGQRQTEATGRPRWVHEQAMSFLRANMGDPDLSLDDLARTLRCSKRYLHIVFQHLGHTPMQALKELRLAHCYYALRQPHSQRLPVCSIALAAGFRDPAHFGRLFRARYGMTPGDWRRWGGDAVSRHHHTAPRC